MTDLQARDLFDAEMRRWITQSLGLNTVLLVGPVGSGAEDLAVAQIERSSDPVALRPTVNSSESDFVADLVTALVGGAKGTRKIGSGWPSPAARKAVTELGRRFGPDARAALKIAEGGSAGPWTLAEAIGCNAGEASCPPASLAIAGVHRLPERLLWELRDQVNAGRVSMIATTRREHFDEVAGPDSPLYGNATVVEVPEVDPGIYEGRLQEPLSPSDSEYLQLTTRGRAGVLVDVFSYWQRGETIQAAWSRAVGSRRHDVETILNLSGDIHAYAPRLLRALANGRPPYAAIPGAPSQRVARALAKLRDLDLIEQPEERTWRIADPVLDNALVAYTGA